MKTIRTKQAKVQLAYFVQRDQHGVIAKDLTQSSISMWRFRFRCRRSFLNSLFIESEVKVLYVRSESSQFGSKGLPGPLTFSTFFFFKWAYITWLMLYFSLSENLLCRWKCHFHPSWTIHATLLECTECLNPVFLVVQNLSVARNAVTPLI